jgi:hypothetical protein
MRHGDEVKVKSQFISRTCGSTEASTLCDSAQVEIYVPTVISSF